MFQDPYSHKINLSNSMNSGQSYVSRNKKNRKYPLHTINMCLFSCVKGESQKLHQKFPTYQIRLKGYMCVGGGFKGAGTISRSLNLPELKV